MKGVLTMSVAKISAFLNVFEAYGLNKTKVIQTAGINPSVLDSPDNRLSVDQVHIVIQQAVALTANPNIGLLQGDNLIKGFSSILGYILMNCSSLGEAFEKYCTYEKIVDETSISFLHLEGPSAIVSIKPVNYSLVSSRQLWDFRLSGMFAYTRLLTGKRIDLDEVRFIHDAPEDVSEYRRIFACPVIFGCPENALVFNRSLLELPIIEPNRDLLLVFEEVARKELEKFEKRESFIKKVVCIILEEMQGNIPSIEIVANKLAMSIRSLQYYLKREGTTYIKLLNMIRRDLAASYLKDKNVTIDEISFFLGFSETSAFHRAFKKWTGFTPCEFRMLNERRDGI